MVKLTCLVVLKGLIFYAYYGGKIKTSNYNFKVSLFHVSSSGRHLASQMGRDETKVENISRKARPSTIREAYGQLSFQTGSNIKQNMQKPCGVDDDKTWKDFKNDFICGLFMVNICNDLYFYATD